MNFTIKKHNQVGILCYQLHTTSYDFSLFFIITPMINSILSHKPNRIHANLLHGLIISGNNLRNRLFHAVICYYRIV